MSTAAAQRDQIVNEAIREISHIATRPDDPVFISDQQYGERLERAMRDDDLVA